MKKASQPVANKYRPLSHHDTYVWALQLHIMFSSGVPLLEALESIARSELPRLAAASEVLAQKISQGYRLSRAMKTMAATFSPFVMNVIAVGEESGMLVGALQRISTRSLRRERMAQVLKRALAYPVLLAAAAIAMALFMACYMLPRILPFLMGSRIALPWPTRVLIWGTNNLGSLLLVVTILAAWGGRVLISSNHPRARRVRAWLLYESPLFGELNMDRIYADCFGDLQVLLDAQCDMVQSLKMLYLPWPEYRQRVLRCVEELCNGAEFSQAASVSGMLPAKFQLQLQTAEETGRLVPVLKHLSEYLDESVSARVEQLAGLLEPVVLCVMGLVTGFVVLATFLPLYCIPRSV